MKAQAFKYRVVGAIFIVSLAVVIIPTLLNEHVPTETSQMTEVISHPLVFSNAPTPLEPSEYAFSDLVDTLKAEEVEATRTTQPQESKEAAAPPEPPATVVQSVTTAPTLPKSVPAKAKPAAAPAPKVASQAAPEPVKPKVVAQAPAQPLPPGYTPAGSTTPLSQPTSKASNTKTGLWAVQMGAFTSEANASALVARLQAQGYSAYVYSRHSSDLLRVLVGVDRDKAKAEQRLAELNTKLQMKGVVIQL